MLVWFGLRFVLVVVVVVVLEIFLWSFEVIGRVCRDLWRVGVEVCLYWRFFVELCGCWESLLRFGEICRELE